MQDSDKILKELKNRDEKLKKLGLFAGHAARLCELNTTDKHPPEKEKE